MEAHGENKGKSVPNRREMVETEIVELIDKWLPSSAGGAVLFTESAKNAKVNGEPYRYVGISYDVRLQSDSLRRVVDIFYSRSQRKEGLCVSQILVEIVDNRLVGILEVKPSPKNSQVRRFNHFKENPAELLAAAERVCALLKPFEGCRLWRLSDSHPLLGESIGIGFR